MYRYNWWCMDFITNQENKSKVLNIINKYFPHTCLKFIWFDDEGNFLHPQFSEEKLKSMEKEGVIKIVETENGRVIKDNSKGWIEELEELGEYRILEELKRREGIN